MDGFIFDIDHFATHDGPGIRTVIFLKGCPLNCVWCHSPESQGFMPELLYTASKCAGCGACVEACPQQAHVVSQNTHKLNRSRCEQCGACAAACTRSALKMSGTLRDASSIVSQAAAYRVFYEQSGGGVTISGGEPLAQPAFALEIAKNLHLEGIHTILETSGMGIWADLKKFLPYVDLFYYDLKIFDACHHLQYTGVLPDIIQSNLENLSRQTRQIVIRMPLIPGYTDHEENVEEVYRFMRKLDLRQIHLLPYNASSQAKYAWVGRDYSPGHLEQQTQKALQSLVLLAPKGIEASVITG